MRGCLEGAAHAWAREQRALSEAAPGQVPLETHRVRKEERGEEDEEDGVPVDALRDGEMGEVSEVVSWMRWVGQRGRNGVG